MSPVFSHCSEKASFQGCGAQSVRENPMLQVLKRLSFPPLLPSYSLLPRLPVLFNNDSNIPWAWDKYLFLWSRRSNYFIMGLAWDVRGSGFNTGLLSFQLLHPLIPYKGMWTKKCCLPFQ